MRKFKVVALSVSGKGKNIYKSGQVIAENGFHDADALVKSGHVAEVIETENLEVVEEKTMEPVTVELGESATIEAENVEAVAEVIETENLEVVEKPKKKVKSND
jgi:hypothetical protein